MNLLLPMATAEASRRGDAAAAGEHPVGARVGGRELYTR